MGTEGTAAREVRERTLSRALAAVAWLAIAMVALPAYLSGIAAPGSFTAVPSYWLQAARWLNAHAGHQSVLVEPGAPFGQYLWGSPLDDVLSPLTSADFAKRNLADIGSPGNERLLDAIDQQMAAGDGSAGLTDLLARMGVKYLVIRNDLDRSALNGAWPARIHQALAETRRPSPPCSLPPARSGCTAAPRRCSRSPTRTCSAAPRPPRPPRPLRPPCPLSPGRCWSTATARASRRRARWSPIRCGAGRGTSARYARRTPRR
jgi:hypothetical protein